MIKKLDKFLLTPDSRVVTTVKDKELTMLRLLLASCLLSMCGMSIQAEEKTAPPPALELPSVFCDNMVLQRGRHVRVWGKASAGVPVTVVFRIQTVTTTAGEDGKWLLKLRPMTALASGASPFVVKSGVPPAVAKKVLRNVVVGDVWFCSGQSNMVVPVRESLNAPHEVSRADFPLIRLFTVEHNTDIHLLEDCKGHWDVCTPATVRKFSAVAFYFGRDVWETMQVPIGLINSSVSGSGCQSWTPLDSILKDDPSAANSQRVKAIQLARIDQVAYDAKVKAIQGQYEVDLAKLAEFEASMQRHERIAEIAYDAGDWKTMALPALWESAGLPDFDGAVWFRKIVEIPETWAGRDLVLNLGPVDEIDQTWFNGEMVECKTPADGVEAVPPLSKNVRISAVLGGAGSTPTVFRREFCKRLSCRLYQSVSGAILGRRGAGVRVPPYCPLTPE